MENFSPIDLKVIAETEEVVLFTCLYRGYPVTIILNKETQQMGVSTADMAQANGFASEEEYLASDLGLDTLQALMQANPGTPALKPVQEIYDPS